MTTETPENRDAWAEIRELLEAGDGAAINLWLEMLPAGEVGRLLSRLSDKEVELILELIGPEEAAEVIAQISDAQAVEIIEDLPSKSAAAIVDELDSDEQADILGDMDLEDAEAILSEMDPSEASDARELIQYDWNTAGGIMITEFLSFKEGSTTNDILDDLRAHRDEYADYDVQYIYITDSKEVVKGVLKIRDLLLSKDTTKAGEFSFKETIMVKTDASLLELRKIFEEHDILGIPVVDDHQRLVGVVRRAAVEEASTEEATEDFLKVSGLSGEEELRSMPFFERIQRRLSWLIIGLVLSVGASTVIAMFEHIVQEVIILAAFLPVVANLSGASGNQAVAVSIRELSLGLVKPWEVFRVLLQEVMVGIFVGLALGVILGSVVGIWKTNWILGAVVGGAMFLNSIVSVALGGCIPLALKWMKQDPALASGPLVMTIADACGFLFTLLFASLMIGSLA